MAKRVIAAGRCSVAAAVSADDHFFDFDFLESRTNEYFALLLSATHPASVPQLWPQSVVPCHRAGAVAASSATSSAGSGYLFGADGFSVKGGSGTALAQTDADNFECQSEINGHRDFGLPLDRMLDLSTFGRMKDVWADFLSGWMVLD
jgi:hypothetical protein